MKPQVGVNKNHPNRPQLTMRTNFDSPEATGHQHKEAGWRGTLAEGTIKREASSALAHDRIMESRKAQAEEKKYGEYLNKKSSCVIL